MADTEADLISALTLTYPAEAIGIALAARDAGMPVVLSVTVETDGNLPDGTTIADAIRSVDDATEAYPAPVPVNSSTVIGPPYDAVPTAWWRWEPTRRYAMPAKKMLAQLVGDLE